MDEAYGYVEMGTRVSQYPIEKYKGVKGRRDRISILSNKPLVTKSHYHEKVGSFYYLDAAVAKGQSVNVRYNFMIVVWDTDSKGALVSTKFTLGILSTGYDAYQNLCDKFELNGDLTKFQMLVTCLESKYQDLSFEIAGQAPYAGNAELFSEIKLRYKEVVNYMPLVIAQKIDEKTFLEKIGEVSTAGFAEPQISKQTNVFSVNNALSFDEDKAALSEGAKEEGKEEKSNITDAVVIQPDKGEKKEPVKSGEAFSDMNFSFDETK